VCRNPAPVIASAPAAASAAPAAPAAPAPAAAPVAPAEEEVSGQTVKSPMVGTAFMAGEPGAAPFIEVGKPVKAGDTLLIIEAMKVMNPITAPAGGVVKKILVSDSQPVEFDQPLVIIG
jgi:acetyl-CoA carboxylase biotin carboxyl carrier protein